MVRIVLIALNVLIFICMVLAGADFFAPTADVLFSWGGMSAESILKGEWWRLFTSMFLHGGLIHLLMNMYGLYFIGSYLEPIFGKARFIVAYLSAGILAALVSFLWHQQTNVNLVCVGASGAIFGMLGVFIVLLIPKLFPEQIRTPLLKNAAILVTVNLLYGFRGGNIDNAAHLGGLVSGLVLGCALYPSVSFLRWKSTLELVARRGNVLAKKRRVNRLTVGAVGVGTLAITALVLSSQHQSDAHQFFLARDACFSHEQRIHEYSQRLDHFSTSELRDYLEREVHPHYINLRANAEKLKPLKLTGDNAKIRDFCVKYYALLDQRFELVLNGVRNDTSAFDIQIQAVDHEIDRLWDAFQAGISDKQGKP